MMIIIHLLKLLLLIYLFNYFLNTLKDFRYRKEKSLQQCLIIIINKLIFGSG